MTAESAEDGRSTAAAETIAVLPLRGRKAFAVTDDHIAKWRDAYPAVDVLAEVRKMVAWLDANPTRRPASNGAGFAVRWLGRQQNDAAGRSAPTYRGRGPLTIAERQLAETDAVIAAMRARGQVRPTDTARLLPVRAPPEPPTHPTAPSAPTRDLFDASEDPC